MKFFCEQKQLLECLKALTRFQDCHSSVQTAGHCLIRVQAGGLVTLTNANLDTRVTLPLEAAAQGEGEYLVHLGLLTSLVRYLSGPLVISGKPGTVTVEAGTDSFALASLPAVEFLEAPTFEETRSVKKISLLRLRQMVKAVLPSAASLSCEVRAPLASIQILGRSGSLSMVATDGRRLSIVASEMENIGEFEALISAKTLHSLVLIPRSDECDVSFGEEFVKISSPHGLEVVCYKIQGRFPKYENVRPKEEAFSTRLIFKKADLVRAIRRAMVFAQERRSLGLIQWDIVQDGIRFSARTSGLGKAAGFVPGALTGEPGLEIGFNGSYLLQGLAAIKEASVEWCFQDESKSSVLRPVECTEFAAQDYLLMPVKLRNLADEYEHWAAR